MPRGVTLLDTILALSLMGIAALIAVPRLSRLLDSIAVRGAASEAHMLFAAARHLAIHRAATVTLEIDNDSDIIRVRTGADTLRVRDMRTVHGVDLYATRASTTYAANGLGYGVANLTLILTRGAAADTLTVSRLGRVRR